VNKVTLSAVLSNIHRLRLTQRVIHSARLKLTPLRFHQRRRHSSRHQPLRNPSRERKILTRFRIHLLPAFATYQCTKALGGTAGIELVVDAGGNRQWRSCWQPCTRHALPGKVSSGNTSGLVVDTAETGGAPVNELNSTLVVLMAASGIVARQRHHGHMSSTPACSAVTGGLGRCWSKLSRVGDLGDKLS
jgi:hypothetical protein